jgi:hypothetical protein
MIDYPKTLLEFLKNIKSLTEGDLLEKEDTFTEENLLRLSGARGVWWQFNELGRRKGELTGLDHFIERSKRKNGEFSSGMHIYFHSRKTEESSIGFISARFVVDSNVPFEQIQQIFGSSWELDEEAVKSRSMQIAQGRIVFPSTHDMGNTPIIYRFSPDQDKNVNLIEIELTANGNLGNIAVMTQGSVK